MRESFDYTDEPNPHPLRSRAILAEHPQVRDLMHHYPLTALYGTLIILAQVGIGLTLSNMGTSWWIIALVAYLVGAFANHCLYVVVHEATHNLIFKKTLPNRLFAIFCDMALILPSSQGFRNFHLIHHSNLSEYDYDADLASHGEAKLVGNSWWRKVLWYLGFMIVEAFRPSRLKKVKLFNGWVVINLIAIIISNYFIYYYAGAQTLGYLGLSTIFGVGLHPVGARWIQEHYIFKPGQWTYSYYGILNKLSFNVGYHVEHHDLIKVPWINLPKLRTIAHKHYDELYAHQSWTKLLLTFLFDKKLDLYARIVRKDSQQENMAQTGNPNATEAVLQ